MPPTVYFNDNEPFVCRWLRNLFPFSRVDRRSITQVTGGEIASYTRVHLFAGIGGWEYALSLAGWPINRPVWTGSAPCQPWSSSGKRKAHADPRNLWPEMLRLINQQRPPTVFGEQVASPLGRVWLAGVRNDLEAIGYAVGAVDMPACCVGAPHLRQRLWWVATYKDSWPANSHGERLERRRLLQCSSGRELSTREGGNAISGMDNSDGSGRKGYESVDSEQSKYSHRADSDGPTTKAGVLNPRMEHATDERPQARPSTSQSWEAATAWARFEVLCGIDGSQRRIEPGTFPLVDGVSRGVGYSGDPSESVLSTTEARVGRLKGYGNAIVPQVAAVFIRSFLEAEQELT